MGNEEKRLNLTFYSNEKCFEFTEGGAGQDLCLILIWKMSSRVHFPMVSSWHLGSVCSPKRRQSQYCINATSEALWQSLEAIQLNVSITWSSHLIRHSWHRAQDFFRIRCTFPLVNVGEREGSDPGRCLHSSQKGHLGKIMASEDIVPLIAPQIGSNHSFT